MSIKYLFRRKKRKAERQSVIMVPVGRILPNPAQTRKSFPDLNRLTESIRRYGIIEPLTVRPVPNAEPLGARKKNDAVYELVSGERRLRAAKIAGVNEVPCVVLALDDRNAAEMSAAANSNRVPLTFFEEATAMASFLDVYGLTQEDTAAVFGIPKSALSGKLRLLRLTGAEKLIITGGGLTERHARAVLKICDPEKRINVIQEAVRLGLSVSETEELVDRVLCPTEEKAKRRRASIKDPRIVYNTIDKAIESIENAGVSVERERREKDDTVELLFRIKKPSRNISTKFPEFSPADEIIGSPKAV
ncbi:MAG: ParB/RepB/Spo0J family partition protein [Clostridia bacterium]|nr:ParB/RepB/Spo0J family partition protein [Clostridia bacterium]